MSETHLHLKAHPKAGSDAQAAYLISKLTILTPYHAF